MAVMAIVGTVDDRFGLGAGVKFFAQIATVLVIIALNGTVVDHLGAIFGTGQLPLGSLAIPFTILCAVGLINAINMLDGLDGLCGGVAIAALAGLTGAAIIGGAPTTTTGPLILIGALVGFLVFNAPGLRANRRRVFLGDAGSLIVGLAIAWFGLDITYGPSTGIPPVATVWILAVPVLDALTVIGRRMNQRRHPMHPDRAHLHHALHDWGLSTAATTATITALTAITATIGIVGCLGGINQSWLFAGLLALLPIQVLAVTLLNRTTAAGDTEGEPRALPAPEVTPDAAITQMVPTGAMPRSAEYNNERVVERASSGRGV